MTSLRTRSVAIVLLATTSFVVASHPSTAGAWPTLTFDPMMTVHYAVTTGYAYYDGTVVDGDIASWYIDGPDICPAAHVIPYQKRRLQLPGQPAIDIWWPLAAVDVVPEASYDIKSYCHGGYCQYAYNETCNYDKTFTLPPGQVLATFSMACPNNQYPSPDPAVATSPALTAANNTVLNVQFGDVIGSPAGYVWEPWHARCR
jgi:hypothetical protein